MVFVLSYSRLMHVSASAQPIDTQTLIYQHDAVFRYFGGSPQECVYDQTKLVVIHEIFRELELTNASINTPQPPVSISEPVRAMILIAKVRSSLE
ncbi:MAG: hypothetical protein PHO08_12200 [Methylococcales bacterium]|nr:hypothetical protein [Methylococcales bacterium]